MKDAPATRKDIDDILGVLQGFVQQTGEQFGKIDEKFEKIDARFEKIDARFEKIDERLDKMTIQINSRLDKIESDVIDLQASHNRLMNTVDHFLARIDRYETEQAARDSQFNRLLDWARKVSKKTGIPLEDF